MKTAQTALWCLNGAAAALIATAGCAGMPEYHKFPSVWPSAMDYTASGEALPEQTGPIVSVSPMRYADDQEGSGVGTADMLTNILLQRLQRKGIAARTATALVEPEGTERLNCTIDKLSYLIKPKYPRSVLYAAELSCALTPMGAAAPRWNQRLAQRYEVQTVVNTMTKLPVPYEQTLLRECVVPLWDAMVVSLKTYLDHAPTPEASGAATEPHAVRQTYSK